MPFPAVFFSTDRNLAVAELNALQSALQKKLPESKKKKWVQLSTTSPEGGRAQKRVSVHRHAHKLYALKDGSRCSRRLQYLVRRMHGIYVTLGGKLIKKISERIVNSPCSYQEANYRYQPPPFVSRIIRLISKLSPFGDEVFRSSSEQSGYCPPVTRCQWWTQSVFLPCNAPVKTWVTWRVRATGKGVSSSCSHAWPTPIMLTDQTLGNPAHSGYASGVWDVVTCHTSYISQNAFWENGLNMLH